MKRTIALLFTALFFTTFTSEAQVDSVKNIKTLRVGIFAPLYLDSVFEGSNYKYNKTFPKFSLPGLDFVQGAQIALDSLSGLPNNVDASFFDTKSETRNIPNLISSRSLDSLNLIIGSVKDADYLQLANFALSKNIPFISATYPNDAGIKANPFVVIVNSTLKAHCEAIYSYLLQNHGSDKIFLARKPGGQEDRIASYFKNINEPDGKPLLNIQTINLADNYLLLENKLDTSKQNIIIGGSLDEKFALKLAHASYTYNKSVSVKLIGMPNWDAFDLNKKNNAPDFPVYYTSPYYNVKWDVHSKMIKDVYQKKYKGNPSDLSYKGFEMAYLFTRLIANHPEDFISHLNDRNKVFTDYNFRPVFLSKNSTTPDYFENKHLYFIKSMNGTVTKAW